MSKHPEIHGDFSEGEFQPHPRPWKARKPDSRVLKPSKKIETLLVLSPFVMMLIGVILVTRAHHATVMAGCITIAFALLLGILAGGLDIYEKSRLRDRKRRNLCVECGYSRGRLKEREACPECGAASWAAW
jgi:hypothetical protein